MTPSRSRDARDSLAPFTLMLALATALLLLFARLAHADPVAAVAAPTTIALGWPEYLALALAALGGVRLIVDGLLVIFRAVAPRTRTKIDDGVRDGLELVHDKLDELGVVVARIAGARATPTPTPTPRDPQAGRSRTGLLITLAATALVVVGVVALLGCTPGQRAGAGQRVGAGLVAALDCEAAHLDAELLADATQLAGATVQRWFGDQSATDDEARAKIKADLAPLKSDLVRCAIAGAVAAIVHRPAQPQGLVTSALSAPGPDPELVRLEIQAAARELGWAPVAAGGEVL